MTSARKSSLGSRRTERSSKISIRNSASFSAMTSMRRILIVLPWLSLMIPISPDSPTFMKKGNPRILLVGCGLSPLLSSITFRARQSPTTITKMRSTCSQGRDRTSQGAFTNLSKTFQANHPISTSSNSTRCDTKTSRKRMPASKRSRNSMGR